jgi:hypothetical protein
MGIPVNKQDQEMRGYLPLDDWNQCGCEVRHVSLRHLLNTDEVSDDPGFASRVTRIKTRFWDNQRRAGRSFQGSKGAYEGIGRHPFITCRVLQNRLQKAIGAQCDAAVSHEKAILGVKNAVLSY